MGVTSFWRDLGKLYALYMLAGLATIPAGVVYALLVNQSWERWWSVLLVLALATVLAKSAWAYFHKRLFPAADSEQQRARAAD